MDKYVKHSILEIITIPRNYEHVHLFNVLLNEGETIVSRFFYGKYWYINLQYMLKAPRNLIYRNIIIGHYLI